MRIPKRLLPWCVAVVATASLGLATPARAVTGPVITTAYCYPGITYWMQCEAHWDGGTDPAVGRWVALSGAWINSSQTYPESHLTLGNGNCIPGAFFSVQVTITDAAGLTDTRTVSGGRRCPV